MAEHENPIGESDDWHIDPCAPINQAHYFVPADQTYTKHDDGLVKPWHGLAFVNPPFGGRRGHVPWLKKFFAHGNGILICRAYTSSDWFHDHVVPRAETLLFPRGKTKFIRPDGSIGTAPGHGIVLVGMGAPANNALLRSGLGLCIQLREPPATLRVAS